MIGKFSNFSGPLSSIISGQPPLLTTSLVLSLDSGLTSSFSLTTGSLEFFSSRYLRCNNNDFKFGTNDFTVELWFYKYSGSPDTFGLINNYYTPNDIGFRIYIDNNNTITGLINEGSNFGFAQHPITVTDDTWHHVALVRNNTSFTLYLDGVGYTDTVAVANLDNSQNANLYIGRSFVNIDGQYFNGLITNVRVSNIAVYTEDFTVSTEQLQSNGNTILLLLATDEYSIAKDSNTDLSPKLITNQNVSFNSSTPITKNFTYTKVWKDTSGNDFNFTFEESPIILNEFGKSLYITGGNFATGSDFGTLNRYTLDIWVNFNTIVDNSTVFTNVWDSNPRKINMFLGNYSDAPYPVWSGSYDGTGVFKSTDTYAVDVSRWYNFVLTVDKNSVFSFFVNGETHSITDYSPFKPTTSGLGYRIGRKWADDEFPVPTIDANVSIINVWDGALTYSTINSNYNNLLDRFTFVLDVETSSWDASASTIVDNRSSLSGTVSDISYVNVNNGVLSFVDQSFINFGNPESLNQNGDISFMIWVNFSSFTTAFNTLAKHYGGGQNDFIFSVKDFTGSGVGPRKMNIYTQNNFGVPGNPYGGLFDTTELESDTWYLLGFTLQNGGDLTYYVNGMTSSIFTNVTRNRANTDFIIASPDSNDGITGKVGNFLMYNRVLSETEILNYYNENYLRYNPYYGSLRFISASSSYLRSNSTDYIVGTNDFTVETWFKSNNTNGYKGVFTNREFGGASGFSINTHDGNVEFYTLGGYNETPINTGVWYHAAISRTGGTASCYLNGNLAFEFSDSNDYTGNSLGVGRYYTNYDGYYFDGLISQSRLIVGTAIYTSNFTPDYTFNNTVDTKFLINIGSENNIIFDNSNYNHEITNQLVGFTSSLPFIGGSFRFGQNDTTQRYITIPASNDFAFGTNDFTVEWFQYQTQAAPPNFSRVFEINSWPNHSLSVSIENGMFLLWMNSGMTQYATTSLTNYLNKWVHFAIARVSGVVSVYKDGTRIWTGTVNTNISNNSNDLWIGSGSNNVWNGYLTNFRLVTGTSVYNVNDLTINVPTSELTAVSGTKLLLNFKESGSIIDTSGFSRPLSIFGSTWSSLSPFG